MCSVPVGLGAKRTRFREEGSRLAMTDQRPVCLGRRSGSTQWRFRTGTIGGMKWLVVLGAVVVVIVAALAAARFAWPSASISAEADGLPTVHVPALAGKVVRVSLHDARGNEIPVELRDDVFRPAVPVVAGSRLIAEAVVRRPGYVSWLRGRTQTVRVELVAPTAHIRDRWLRTSGRVNVEFDRPVRALSVDGRTIHLAAPTRTVSLGHRASPGTAAIRVAAEPWERLSAPTRVTWFPPGPGRFLAPQDARPDDAPPARLRRRRAHAAPEARPHAGRTLAAPGLAHPRLQPARLRLRRRHACPPHASTAHADLANPEAQRAPPRAAPRPHAIPPSDLDGNTRRRRPHVDCPGRRRVRPAARPLRLALPEHPARTGAPVAPRRLHLDRPRRGDGVPARAPPHGRRLRRPRRLARADCRRPGRPSSPGWLQLRVRARGRPAVAEPLARRPRDPDLARATPAFLPRRPSSARLRSSSTSRSGR